MIWQNRKGYHDIYDSPANSKFKTYIKVLIVLIIILLLLLINFNTYYSLKIARNYISTMETVYSRQTISFNDIKSSIPAIKDSYYEDNLSKLLSAVELNSLARLNWKYALTVNGIDIIGDSITIEDTDVYICLTETKDASKPLPKKIFDLGSLASVDSTKKFYDYLNLDSTLTHEIYIDTEGETTYAYYDYVNVPSGSIITLKIGEQLKERLQLASDIIKVNVK